MQSPFRSLASSPFQAAIASGVVILFGLACIGALMDQPGRQAPPAVGTSAADVAFSTAASLQTAAHPQPINVSLRNLQLPRAPRHRGERPTSGVEEVEGITSATILAILANDSHRPFVLAAVQCCPLAGHPLSLLRPPSLLAG